MLKKYRYSWGGNHFIELNEDDKGNVYIVIHSGSRNLGKQIAEYYQNFAYEQLIDVTSMKDEIIKRLMKEGEQKKYKKLYVELRSLIFEKN